MRISIIATIGYKDSVYDKNLRLLKHLSIYLKYFDKMTTSKLLVMDKNAYEYICHHTRKPLGATIAGRKIIIFSKTPNLEYAKNNENITHVNSITGVLSTAQKIKDNEIIIVGGRDTHQKFFPLASRLYLIHPFGDYLGCQYFTKFRQEDWVSIYRCHKTTKKLSPCDISLKALRRVKKHNKDKKITTIEHLKI